MSVSCALTAPSSSSGSGSVVVSSITGRFNFNLNDGTRELPASFANISLACQSAKRRIVTYRLVVAHFAFVVIWSGSVREGLSFIPQSSQPLHLARCLFWYLSTVLCDMFQAVVANVFYREFVLHAPALQQVSDLKPDLIIGDLSPAAHQRLELWYNRLLVILARFSTVV